MADVIDTATSTEPVGNVNVEPTAPTEVDNANPALESDQGVAKVDNEPTDHIKSGLTGETDVDSSEGEVEQEPQDYDFSELEIEGFDVDQPTAEEFAKVAKEVGLDQKSFSTLYKKMMPYMAQRQEEQLNELRTQFIADAKKDPEIGGAKFNESLRGARLAFKKYVDPETQSLLQASGLDCHPGLIRAFAKIHSSISDDVSVRGTQASKRDPAKAFFYNSNMN